VDDKFMAAAKQPDSEETVRLLLFF